MIREEETKLDIDSLKALCRDCNVYINEDKIIAVQVLYKAENFYMLRVVADGNMFDVALHLEKHIAHIEPVQTAHR